ncbi:MAG TPA: UbiX family flavin prenyltransferase [Methanocella sp.]|uniref:UbiX family flavin prenyltransferase n=1 Tax=Methanocella sp. TaxID=2052833 RepID=UPI002B8E9F4A|nr:UbiX family flavin prenyltransferase [Methanocella sp.]HTY92177.1 UbiX family flavin prenyltransferase [Methanocella sp.]
MRIIIGMTGASGVQYGIRLLEALEGNEETHLVLSQEARELVELETDLNVNAFLEKATFHYEDDDFLAPIASGSYRWDAMVIVPCTMKTLAGIANGYADTLIGRAADVTLKESRRLILVPREMPLNLIHLENMVKLKQAGAVIMPACPGFYNNPKTIDDLVDNVVGRILDQLGIDNEVYRRWGEKEKKQGVLPSTSHKIR